MWQHLCVCVCLCFLLGYLHVPLVRRSATAATATATTAAGRQIAPGKGEWGNGEPLLTPKYWHWRQNAFELSIYTNLIRLPLPIPKKTSSESCEMHLLLKLISTLGLSWVSAQHEMPEFVGGCASAFNQLQICKYLLNWLTLSVERFSCSIWKRFLHTQRCSEAETRNHLQFFYNLDQKNHKNFEALNNGKPQLFGNDWQSHSVSLSLSSSLCSSPSLSINSTNAQNMFTV